MDDRLYPTLLACALAAVVAAIPAVARGDGSESDSTSFSVIAGRLAASPAHAVRVKQRHRLPGTRASVYRVSVKVVDATGTGRGWHLWMRPPAHAGTSVVRASVRPVHGSVALPHRRLHYPVVLRRSRRTVFRTARGSGMGTFVVTLTVAVRPRRGSSSRYRAPVKVAPGP
jgi:hypothetical protein